MYYDIMASDMVIGNQTVYKSYFTSTQLKWVATETDSIRVVQIGGEVKVDEWGLYIFEKTVSFPTIKIICDGEEMILAQ